MKEGHNEGMEDRRNEGMNAVMKEKQLEESQHGVLCEGS